MARAQIIVTSCNRRSLELEQVKAFLRGNNYSVSEDEWHVDGTADLILLSTCGFTQAAEDYGFQTLRRIQRDKKPAAQIVFGGCIPKINPQRVAAEFGGPTFSPQTYHHLNDLLQAERPLETFNRPNTFPARPTLITDIRKGVDLLKTFDGSWAGLSYISHHMSNGLRRRLIRTKYANLASHETFYIQIQEGCSMHCAYCAIRTAIGPQRSKPPAQILAELRDGLARGYRHFQLMGDNAGGYGHDLGTNLGRLLENILDIDGAFELDLTDINPVYLATIIQPVKALCAQHKVSRLYVPIQSGSRRILKLMGRDCDLDAVRGMLVEVKQSAPPAFKLGTSLVVGFPSETQADLDSTIEFCRQAGFDWIWCHSFSARPETPAAQLAQPIPPEEILRRAQYVREQLRTAQVTTAEDTQGSRTCQG